MLCSVPMVAVIIHIVLPMPQFVVLTIPAAALQILTVLQTYQFVELKESAKMVVLITPTVAVKVSATSLITATATTAMWMQRSVLMAVVLTQTALPIIPSVAVPTPVAASKTATVRLALSVTQTTATATEIMRSVFQAVAMMTQTALDLMKAATILGPMKILVFGAMEITVSQDVPVMLYVTTHGLSVELLGINTNADVTRTMIAIQAMFVILMITNVMESLEVF